MLLRTPAAVHPINSGLCSGSRSFSFPGYSGYGAIASGRLELAADTPTAIYMAGLVPRPANSAQPAGTAACIFHPPSPSRLCRQARRHCHPHLRAPRLGDRRALAYPRPPGRPPSESRLPWHNELTWRTGAPRKPLATWRRTAWTSPGFPRITVIPPRTRRWPWTWRPGARPRPTGCTTTWPRAPRSSTGPLPARSAAEWHRSWWARPATTAALSGTRSRASAGSRSTTLPPSETSSDGSGGSASTRPMYGSSRPTSPATRWPAAARGRARPGGAQPVPARRGGRLPGACRP